jgi:ubiquitin C-terminal hydrolase
MNWYGFTNYNASCYMDSLLVALFCARHRDVASKLLLSPALDAQTSTALPGATTEWRATVRRALADEVTSLFQSRPRGESCFNFRQQLASVPRVTTTHLGDAVTINFAAPMQQSAVDFLHYLVDALGGDDAHRGFAEVQYSTTFMKRRDEVEHAPSLGELADTWKRHPIVKRFFAANAHQLEDASERAALQADTSGQACILENAEGDRRRISAPERVVSFSCHFSLEDRAVPCVPLLRDLEPQVEHMSKIEGYTGPWFAKMNACRIKNAPMLIFEVSRKVNSVMKLATPVAYGEVDGENVVLRIDTRMFCLTAVVAHVGNAQGGHYNAFVCSDEGKWYFYDDALADGRMMELPDVRSLESLRHSRPSIHGELFFYSPMP